jgi:hypothetical protein
LGQAPHSESNKKKASARLKPYTNIKQGHWPFRTELWLARAWFAGQAFQSRHIKHTLCMLTAWLEGAWPGKQRREPNTPLIARRSQHMHSNTVVKPRRLAQRAGPAGPTPQPAGTAHRDPEPHEILATTTNHPPSPLPRPVPASQNSAARRPQRSSSTLLSPSPLAHSASRKQQQTGRTKTAPLPPPPAPLLSPVVSFPSPFPPAPRVLHSPLARSSPRSLPRFLLRYGRAPALLPDFCPRNRPSSVRLFRRDLLCLGAGEPRCGRPGAAGQVSFRRRLRCLGGRWQPPPPLLPALVT